MRIYEGRNTVILLAIYTENKSRIDYVPRWGKTKLKSQITKIIFRNFIIEEIFLRNPNGDGIPAFRRTEFEWHCSVPSFIFQMCDLHCYIPSRSLRSFNRHKSLIDRSKQNYS